MIPVITLNNRWATAILFPLTFDAIAPIIAVMVVPTLAPIARVMAFKYDIWPAAKAVSMTAIDALLLCNTTVITIPKRRKTISPHSPSIANADKSRLSW